MSVKLLPPGELDVRLDDLYNCLTTLPPEIPKSNERYNFIFFSPSSEDIEDYGLDGAVNHALEIGFCPEGRRSGITLSEQGPGLTGVVEVLRRYNGIFPGNAVLQKWVLDLLESAQRAGGKPQSIEEISDDSDESNITNAKRKKKKAAHSNKKVKLGAKSAIDLYVDLDPESEPRGKGGRQTDPLLERMRVLCHLKDDPEKKRLYRCIGAVDGCQTYWSKKSGFRERVFVHTSRCRHVPSRLKQDVINRLGNQSLGKYFEKSEDVSTKDEYTDVEPDRDFDQSSSIVSGLSRGSSLRDMAMKAGRAELSKKIDHAIMKLICVRGIPPTIVDSPEWKDLLRIAAPNYPQTGTKSFVDSMIPMEYAYIKLKQEEHLKMCKNLTISFDGGTTASLQSIYTVHIITPERRIFFVEGSEASTQSHTAKHIFHVLDTIIQTFGPERFRGITSDNTGNTSAARKLIQEAYPWIIILPDPCHRLNLLCKDVGKIEYFSRVIKLVQRVVKFFRKSTHATSNLKEKRKNLGISQGIRSIGKTHFGTVYSAADSIEKNYPAISSLCQQKIITIPDINHVFLPGFEATDFVRDLTHLTSFLAPIAKSIQCLESSHSTVADVYFFWLAITVNVNDLLIRARLDTRVKEEIRLAVNYRFNQMLNEAPSDVFLTGFILDPRFRKANIFRDLNPLAIQKLKIPARDGTGSSSSERSLPDSLRRAGNFLLSLLRAQYKNIVQPIAGLRLADAFSRLPEQVIKYQKGVYPFEHPLKVKETAIDWWIRLDRDTSKDAQPLAYLARSIFEVLPNSMADERTASTITWLNSPLRNRQEVNTLVRMVTIRQWYAHNPDKPSPPFIPSVRFFDMSSTLFESKGKSGKMDSPHSSNPVDDNRGLMTDDFGCDEDDMDMDRLGGNEGPGPDIIQADDTQWKDERSGPSGPDLEDEINFSAPALRDLLTDNGLIGGPSVYEAKLDTPVVENAILDELLIDLDDDAAWTMPL